MTGICILQVPLNYIAFLRDKLTKIEKKNRTFLDHKELSKLIFVLLQRDSLLKRGGVRNLRFIVGLSSLWP